MCSVVGPHTTMEAPSKTAPRRDSRRAAKAAVVSPGKDPLAGGPFGLRVRLRDTGELYSVAECRAGTRVRELKTALELVAGIPTEFQRLSYLDEGDLPDESTLRFNDVVPGGTVTLTVWRQGGWAELVRAAAAGDVPRLQSLLPRGSGLCASRDCRGAPEMTAWHARRAFSALFISAHRGHLPALRFLLQNGANVKMQTQQGRGALHVAAGQGHPQCVELLLSWGAPASQPDSQGLTPLGLATLLGQKRSVRQLCLFQWQQRAAGVHIRPHLDEEQLFAHQRFDSQLKPWRRGPQAQVYMASLLKKGEFQGTGLGAPRSAALSRAKGKAFTAAA